MEDPTLVPASWQFRVEYTEIIPCSLFNQVKHFVAIRGCLSHTPLNADYFRPPCLLKHAAMPPTDDVHLFGNDDAGDALFEASLSKISLHRRLRLLLDTATNQGQQSIVQRRCCPPKQVMSRGTITTVRCVHYKLNHFHVKEPRHSFVNASFTNL